MIRRIRQSFTVGGGAIPTSGRFPLPNLDQTRAAELSECSKHHKPGTSEVLADVSGGS